MPDQEGANLRELFAGLEKVLLKEPERTVGLTALYQFELTGDRGGNWYVRIEDGTAQVSEGEAPHADCSIIAKDSDFVAIATKQITVMSAYMKGKLKFKGDPALAMKAMSIFT
jgi:putative sterol carrier protein